MTADISLVYLGLGGNLGDVAMHFEQARQALESHPKITSLRASSQCISKAWGGGVVDVSKQNDYLNEVVELETRLPAKDLLGFCQQLELEAGRNPQAERWAARPLDIDILLYGQQLICTSTLELPHPRMLMRAFVLKPLAELSPKLQIPGASQVLAALQALSPTERNTTQRFKKESN
ncbi:MAG: 2-amino-4-hydroxy-6-hydroxymethyldihydropteridine diphosphokinase [Xanthomonadales bacterium]|nr:2-amino-4-hydroxy-6-hydroxymethyldihydropteridine diphosphokinase [Xanthomonadales bacterium]